MCYLIVQSTNHECRKPTSVCVIQRGFNLQNSPLIIYVSMSFFLFITSEFTQCGHMTNLEINYFRRIIDPKNCKGMPIPEQCLRGTNLSRIQLHKMLSKTFRVEHLDNKLELKCDKLTKRASSILKVPMILVSMG